MVVIPSIGLGRGGRPKPPAEVDSEVDATLIEERLGRPSEEEEVAKDDVNVLEGRGIEGVVDNAAVEVPPMGPEPWDATDELWVTKGGRARSKEEP